MTTTIESITTSTITGLLDEAARELADVPGRAPQDAQIGACLLAYTMSGIQGEPSRMLLSTLERRGVNGCEAEAVALALRAYALRLGAWLGRHENSPRNVTGRPQTHESERTR